MQEIKDDSTDLSLKVGVREIQTTYYAKYPENKALYLGALDMENVKKIFEVANRDVGFIKKVIMGLPLTMKDGKTPTFSYILHVVSSEYTKTVAPKKTMTDEEVLAACELSPEQQMYLSINQTMIDDIIPKEELPIKGFGDPNILKAIRALHEDGRITDAMLGNGVNGFMYMQAELSSIASNFKPMEKGV